MPDETDRVLVLRPLNPTVTVWPDAEFIVGNPPFIAGKDLRAELGDGYTEALWAAYPKVPRSADMALHFWWKAAQALRTGKPLQGKAGKGKAAKGLAGSPVTQRFGFITSNSLRQVFCRRVVADAMAAKPGLHLAFAIPDHPWTDGRGTAAVRIAMTVAESGPGVGTLAVVTSEKVGADGVPQVSLDNRRGLINGDLTIGTDVKAAKPLKANDRLASPGMKLHCAGFIVSPTIARTLGLGRVAGLEQHIRPYLNGRDLTQRSRGDLVIDLFGLSEGEVRTRYPDAYQHVLLHVKPERDQNNRASYRDNWWVFGEPRKDLRPALVGLRRYIATVETAKHRLFTFLPAEVLPDNRLVCFASDDAQLLGVLQSKFHVSWSLAVGGTLEDRPIYTKTECFDPFPFPTATLAQCANIAAIAEELDAHRKSRLAAHPQLTLTGLYNVLAAVRAGTPLTPAERDVHDAGQVSILRALHDRLDEAVAAAYGWPADLPDAEIVARVVALNAERVAEEAQGQVRWLRPAFQSPRAAAATTVQPTLDVGEGAPSAILPWPKEAPAQFVQLRAALAAGPATPAHLARRFKGARAPRVRDMLETLAALGQAREAGAGRYMA